jgi:large subunit ribosomal protein L25
MSEKLTVKKRDEVGSLAARRLRREGRLPAVLYGHKQPTVGFSVCADELATTLRHGAKVVQLAGDESGQALLQHLQWDTFGREVLHVDLLRVDASERVDVEIAVEGKGEAPGENEGGVMTWVNHMVHIECTPDAIPEKLHIDLSKVHLGDTVTAEAVIDLPKGGKLLSDPHLVLLNCVRPMGDDDEAADAAARTGAEPELVGRKKGDDEESDD